MALPQLFGIIPTGCPVIINPSSAPSPTSLVFNLPPRPFSHIAVFLLPGIDRPPDTAAAVYLASPISPSNQNAPPNFKFLGGIGPGKESAIFKVSQASNGNGSSEVDMDAPESPQQQSSELILGISIESSASVSAQMAALAAKPPIPIINEPTNALVLSKPGTQPPNTLLLAQRIIKNAFNFLASFADGEQKVPLKTFENWWSKFEGRLRTDPSFLEREGD
jgi:hypothetical protein